MRLRFFGGLSITTDDGPVTVRGRGRQALLFRLALDAGTDVTYRALTDDIWPHDGPDDPRAALHSLASRLRRDLPAEAIVAIPGGYRLAVDREAVDIARFTDLVDAARGADAASGAALARQALDLWSGAPWTPDEGFAWVLQDLHESRDHALRLARATVPPSTVAPSDGDPLPAPLTALVGRDDELALIATQLETERLVTVLGPGGAGKTTLALESARRHEGSLFVELAPVNRGEIWNALDGAVGRRMRITDTSSEPQTPRDRTLQALRGRDVLLVLDNCEHIVGAVAEAARQILLTAPAVRILATSREPLGVPGEAFVALGPLPPEDGRELFARRVRAARGVAPHDDEHDLAARIVDRVDGLPLAIELAAAKSRTLTLAEIEDGLDDRFALLQSMTRVGDTRHQTLRALIDWSWDLLTDGERDAMRATAVFPDGLGAEDLTAITAAFGITRGDVDALVDRSLLRRSRGRYRMLETVREYGLDRLRGESGLQHARHRQASVMADLALLRDAQTRGREVRGAVAWFDANEDNLVAATRWCAAEGETRLGIALARAQLWVWLMRERIDEIDAALTDFAPAATGLGSEAEVVLSAVELGRTIFSQSRGGSGRPSPEDLDDLTRRADTIVAAARRHPSELTLAFPAVLPSILETIRTTDGAQGWSQSSLLHAEPDAESPDWTRALVAALRAAAAQNSGDRQMLGEASAEALAIFRRLGDPWGTALAAQLRSEWFMLGGRLEDALELADDAARSLTGLATASDIALQRAHAIGILTRLGRMDEVRERLVELRAFARTAGGDRARLQAAFAAMAVAIADDDAEAALAALADADEPLLRPLPEQVVAWGASQRARVFLIAGRVDDARDALRAAIPLALRTGDQPIIADVLVSVAAWLTANGETTHARRALASADVLRGGPDDSDPFGARIRRRLDESGAPVIVIDPGAPDLQTLHELEALVQ